jgi:hypothetical protein
MVRSRLMIFPTWWWAAGGGGSWTRVGVWGRACRVWRTNRMGGPRVDVPESAADPSGGEAARGGGALPGAAEVVGQRPGETQLGVAGDDQPGPAVGGLGGAELRAGPAEGLLKQPEGVLKIEPAEKRLPPAVDVGGGGAGARRPQPHRLGSRSPGRWSTCRRISVPSMMPARRGGPASRCGG